MALAAAACSHVQAASVRRELEQGGRARFYYVHLPPQVSNGAPLPVVLNFHGGGGTAPGQETYSGMDAVADEEGFIVVYPSGSGRLGERLLTWNAGGCCGYAQDEAVDDVGFVRALIEDLSTVTPIDRSRIYATGLSNGAMMSYRLGAEAADVIAAIAPVAGAMTLDSFAPARPLPILHIHSVDDPRALYDGGLGPPFPLTNRRVEHQPVESVLARWATFDGCRSEPAEARRQVGPSGTDQTATLWVYSPCADGVEVALWKLTGVGHVWPGGTPDYLTRILGPSTAIIDANREMWAFLSRFKMP
jgi:polyhydroxybutyrate depolymerase